MKKINNTGFRRRFLPGVIVLVAVFGLSGCYTRLAVVDHDYDRIPDYVDEGDYLEGDYYDGDYYADNYWRPRSYRRYFSNFYGSPYYNHFGYDPFYSCFDYFWCDPFGPIYYRRGPGTGTWSKSSAA